MYIRKTWENITEQYANDPCDNTINSVLSRMVLATTVYYIWKERNTRMFTGEKLEPYVLKNAIMEKVKLQLLCLKVKKSTQVLNVACCMLLKSGMWR